NAVIDDIAADADADLVAAVDLAAPVRGSEGIEVVRVFVFEKRFSFAIAALLLEIGPDRVAAIMPHLGCGCEADAVAEMLQAPDEIDVVAGFAELRIKTVHLAG